MVHTLFIWTVYFIGQCFHILLQADAVARSKNNPISTRWGVIRQNAIAMAARVFVCWLLFVLIWDNPTALSGFFEWIGISISPRMQEILNLPMNVPLAGVYGMFSDSLLGYIPFMKNALPKIEGDGN